MPAVSLQDTIGGITVSVEAEAGVFPANTSLVLSEQEDNGLLLPLLEEMAESKVDSFEAVEISFEDENGDTVEPQNSYNVKMTSDSMKEDVDRVLVQVAGEVASVVDDTEFTYKQVEFSADVNATFAIVEKSELTSEYLSADGNLYEVTVTYDYSAKIPENARLTVSEYERDSVVYKSSRLAFMSALENAEETADGEASSDDELFMDIIDITIRDENGDEVEPFAPVQVTITRKNLPDNFDGKEGSLLVQHLNNSGAKRDHGQRGAAVRRFLHRQLPHRQLLHLFSPLAERLQQNRDRALRLYEREYLRGVPRRYTGPRAGIQFQHQLYRFQLFLSDRGYPRV